MKRSRIISGTILGLMMLLELLILPVNALIDFSDKVYDEAGLLNVEQVVSLSASAREISLRQQMDLVIVTVLTTEGKSTMAYADDFYDNHGFGYGEDASGLLLLIDMEQRVLWISTTGEAITLFDDVDINRLLDAVYNGVANGDFYGGCRTFLNQADSHISSARAANLSLSERYSPGERLLFSLLIGFAAAVIILLWMVKRHQRSLALPPAAYTYLQNGTERFTKQEDTFLHTHTSSIPIPRKKPGGNGTTVHRGSSGRMHGGGGRRF